MKVFHCFFELVVKYLLIEAVILKNTQAKQEST